MWAAIGKAALQAAPALIGTFAGRGGGGGGGGVNYRRIIDRWRAEKPTGYLTEDDTKFADANFASGAEKVAKQSRSARTAAAGRILAKGLGRSGASEAMQEAFDEQQSGALTDLSRSRDATLYGIRTGREKYQQGMNLQGMMAELSGARSNFEAANANRAGFFNSLLELAPEVFDFFGSKGKPSLGGGSTVGGFLPGSGAPGDRVPV